jgi:hypothetical protein
MNILRHLRQTIACPAVRLACSGVSEYDWPQWGQRVLGMCESDRDRTTDGPYKVSGAFYPARSTASGYDAPKR